MTLSAASADADILTVLHRVADAVAGVLASNTDWSLSGKRRSQYSVDLHADEAALAILHEAGCTVLSEESGVTTSGVTGSGSGLFVVMDPLDGSTNASRGVKWFATALCVLDDRGMRAALVANQSGTGDRWTATRGGGAFKNGNPITPSACTELSAAIVGVSGIVKVRPGWAQFRALGAAALDLCLVAEGVLDGWIDFNSHGGWDYMASLLICSEAGVAVRELEGREPVVREHGERRTLVVAATPELLVDLVDVRVRHAQV
jgi:fructose-1,6-bisphosphatase/inositol monophosphatase family enzyme